MYIDFGFEWTFEPLNGEAGNHRCDGLPLRDCLTGDSLVPGAFPNPEELPRAILPYAHYIERFQIDYDGNGVVDERDARNAADDVLEQVRRIYDPFNVVVEMANASRLIDLFTTLSSTPRDDVYVLVGGQITSRGRNVGGKASQNDGDGLALVSAASFVGITPNFDGNFVKVAPMAKTIAHEVGHRLGLSHTGGDAGAHSLHAGDVMGKWGYDIGATFLRFDLPLTGVSSVMQNAYEILEETVGLRPGAPAYVTGTGAHDVISITASGLQDHALVVVDAYADPAYSELVASDAYLVRTSNGIAVDGSRGDDVVVLGDLNLPLCAFCAPQPVYDRPVTLRGNLGDDILIGNVQGETLDGGWGSDVLQGGGGDDRYVFDGFSPEVRENGTPFLRPPPFDDVGFGLDRIHDISGIDTLDFSRYPRPILLDLALTQPQAVDRVLPYQKSPGTVPAISDMFSGLASDVPLQRLLLEHGASIENVRGSKQDDEIWGNALANRLYGNAGDDALLGDLGADILIGGGKYLLDGELYQSYDVCVDEAWWNTGDGCEEFQRATRQAWEASTAKGAK